MGKKVSIPADVIDCMVGDVFIKSAIRHEHGVRFREEYDENKQFWREKIRSVFDNRQKIESSLMADSDPVRTAVFEVMSQFSDSERKQESFEAYVEFLAAFGAGVEPLEPEAFFNVTPERTTGSGLPVQYGRHRPNNLRGRRVGSDSPASVQRNFEHLQQGGIKLGCMVYSTLDFKSCYRVVRISADCQIFFDGENGSCGHDPRDYSLVK